MQAGRQQAGDIESVCAWIHALLVSWNIHSWDACQMSNYPRLRCLLSRTREGRNFKRFQREMKINFRVIWLLKVNEWKSMQSQWRLANAAEQINEFSSLMETFPTVPLNMQTKHSDSVLHSQISPFSTVYCLDKHTFKFVLQQNCHLTLNANRNTR